MLLWCFGVAGGCRVVCVFAEEWETYDPVKAIVKVAVGD
jgi:hypothetical protein